jgi:hypothetical protein
MLEAKLPDFFKYDVFDAYKDILENFRGPVKYDPEKIQALAESHKKFGEALKSHSFPYKFKNDVGEWNY